MCIRTPSTQEAEVGGLRVPGSQGDVARPCLKNLQNGMHLSQSAGEGQLRSLDCMDHLCVGRHLGGRQEGRARADRGPVFAGTQQSRWS